MPLKYRSVSDNQPAFTAFLHRSPAPLPQIACTPARVGARSASGPPAATPSPFHARSGGLGPEPRPVSHPQGRQPHQRFPAAGAPIGGRPAAPNINDTQEPSLEAQAREPTPISATPATGTEQFSILSGASGNPLEAETGSREQPPVLSPHHSVCLTSNLLILLTEATKVNVVPTQNILVFF